MRQLPEFVQSALPVVITKKGAICSELLEQLVQQILTTSNFSAAAGNIRELSCAHLHKTQNEYLQFLEYRRQLYYDGYKYSSTKYPYDLSSIGLDDQGASNMFCYNPSAKWLEDIFMECMEQPLEFVLRYQASITGRYLCADHTFKSAKYIRNADRSKTYEGIFTVMNELCQVVAQYMVQTKSWLEIKAGMTLLWKRYGLVSEHTGVLLEELVSI